MAVKNILLGITGGIAAYKTLELIRLLTKSNYHVKAILTKSAEEFVTPLSVATLSNNPVFTANQNMEHIELANWADLILIVPASANTIAKIAHGIADDLLSTTFLTSVAPCIVAPAMNVNMWNNPATQNNRL